nr:MAG TPA: tail protein [Caudoviricetes sp.]
MMIRVYDATEKLFNHNGIKSLNPLFAEILKVDNGDYYIELEDVLDNLDYYQKGMIIRVNTPWGTQGFRCDNLMIKNNRVTCKAWHLSYDSENYIISEASVEDESCNEALNHYNNSTDTESPFFVVSNISALKTTSALRKSLFDVFSDLVNVYSGHWVRDNFFFGIASSIGQDRGVVLAYNKNITEIKIEENWDNVCTKLLPYVKNGDTVITLDDIYVESSENPYDIPYTKAVEFQYRESEEETAPSSAAEWQEWLHDEAVKYLEDNKLPRINYTVSAKLDDISDIGDIVYVRHPKCKVDIKTDVISVKYDAIKGKYTAIEFGNFKKEIKGLVNEVASVVKTDNTIKQYVAKEVKKWKYSIS